jgi:hypothetical protein
MPRRNAALSLVALAALGLATGCEKQSPWVTVTADGVVVKARAQKYCRENGKCNESKESPVIEIDTGDTLGIDVPRSVANEGWRAPDLFGDEVFKDHYKAFTIPNVNQPGDIPLRIVRAGGLEGTWQFTLRVK